MTSLTDEALTYHRENFNSNRYRAQSFLRRIDPLIIMEVLPFWPQDITMNVTLF